MSNIMGVHCSDQARVMHLNSDHGMHYHKPTPLGMRPLDFW